MGHAHLRELCELEGGERVEVGVVVGGGVVGVVRRTVQIRLFFQAKVFNCFKVFLGLHII